MSTASIGAGPSLLPFRREEQPLPVVGGVQVQAVGPEEFLGPLNDYEARNAPKTIFAAGDTALLAHGRKVSVVGSRDASEEELKRARRLVRELVSHCVTVVSGLAAGIDTAAHQEAISEGGRTIAVLGTALDQTYPASNANLQHEIMARHVVVSQFPFGSKTLRRNFAIRNRTMALISDATVIVTASETSGTQHQGWEAIRLGRPLFFLDSLLAEEISWIREQMKYGGESLGSNNLELFFDHLPERAGLEPIAF